MRISPCAAAAGRIQPSDAELIAILIGSGTVGCSAVSVAQEVLGGAGHSLHDLGRFSIKDLQKHKGIGEAKAITIAAALELGRRRQLSDLRERPRITSSRDAFQVIAPLLTDLNHEEFWVLLLNQANEVREKRRISSGGMTATVVDVRIFFRMALEAQCAGVIAVHNHPSGDPAPSRADIDMTAKIVAIASPLGIVVHDHIIVGRDGHASFKALGLLG